MAADVVIPENEVTKETLAALFTTASLTASIDEEGVLVVQTFGQRISVWIDEERKLLSFQALWGVKEAAPLELKHALTNKMNSAVVLVRFSIPEAFPTRLVADYYLPYEGGISALLVVSAMYLFQQIVPIAIESCDDNDLVE